MAQQRTGVLLCFVGNAVFIARGLILSQYFLGSRAFASQLAVFVQMVNRRRSIFIDQNVAAPHHAAELQAQGFAFHSAEEAVFRLLQPVHLHETELLTGIVDQIQRVAELQHRAVAHDHHAGKMVFVPVDGLPRQHFAVAGLKELNLQRQAHFIVKDAGAEVIGQADIICLQNSDSILDCLRGKAAVVQVGHHADEGIARFVGHAQQFIQGVAQAFQQVQQLLHGQGRAEIRPAHCKIIRIGILRDAAYRNFLRAGIIAVFFAVAYLDSAVFGIICVAYMVSVVYGISCDVAFLDSAVFGISYDVAFLDSVVFGIICAAYNASVVFGISCAAYMVSVVFGNSYAVYRVNVATDIYVAYMVSAVIVNSFSDVDKAFSHALLTGIISFNRGYGCAEELSDWRVLR